MSALWEAIMTKHGLAWTRGWRAWCNMRSRCQNPKNNRYPWYGGKGIKVCERWGKFENFISDMGRPPTDLHTIDRIDNEHDYCPENCRWATAEEQRRNRTDNHLLTYQGKTQPTFVWAKELNMSYQALKQRIHYGWSDERILSQPIRKW